MTVAAAAKKRQQLHHKLTSSKGQLSSLTHMCCCLPSPLSMCYLCYQPCHYHTFILLCKLTKTINQDCALFARIGAKPRTRPKRCPYVSNTFRFIRAVSAEQPNITDTVHSASNNLAIEQICSVLHTGIEGYNSFSYNHLGLVISMYHFKHMQGSHAYAQRLTVHLTVTLLDLIRH